jgi:hypothetical protein
MIIRVAISVRALRMKSTRIGIVVLPALVAGLWAIGASASPGAADSHDYEIAANDGYGIEDCLAAGSDCGQVVADSWCEAHGRGHALAYGLRNAIEGRPTPVSAVDEPYVIKCGD